MGWRRGAIGGIVVCASFTLVSVFALSHGGAKVGATGSIAITGTVTNQSGAGVANVSVTADAPGTSTVEFGPATTASDGTYTIYVDAGSFDFHFDPPSGSGLNPSIDSGMTVANDQTINVQLTMITYTLSGILTDQNGDPLPIAVVRVIVSGEHGYSTFKQTSSNGAYSMQLPPDFYSVSISYDPSDSSDPLLDFNLFSRGRVDLTSGNVRQDLKVSLVTLTIGAKDQDGNPIGYQYASVNGLINNTTPLLVGSTTQTVGGVNDLCHTMFDSNTGQTFCTKKVPVGTTFDPSTGSTITANSGGPAGTLCIGASVTITQDTTVFLASCLLPAPTNLTIPSPTQNPNLTWTAVSGAISYNIYRNGTNIGSTTNTTYTDNTAPEGTDTYDVTAVNASGESSPSNPPVSALVDRTAPTITYTPNPINAWYNSPTTITFNCTDNTGGSGVASYSPPQTESADGSYILTGTCTDNAGNSSSVNVTVNIDQTAPTVSNVTLATDPLTVNQTTTLSATVADNLSGVSKAEYYTGTDPGQGSGTAMSISSGSATATVGSFAAAGMHTYYVRSEDNAGNWSNPTSVTLDVYNPSGGYAAGHGSIVPNGSTSNTNPGDTLPTETGNNLKANFDFTIKYASSSSTVPTGTSTFTWGSTCNNPHSDCFVVTTDTTVAPSVGSLSWLIVPGDNTATFQGVAALSQGTTNLGNNFPVRVTVTGTTTTSPGHYVLQVFNIGDNPDTAAPLYQASGDLIGGAVVMHQ